MDATRLGHTKKKSVSCRPGEAKKDHPGGQGSFFS